MSAKPEIYDPYVRFYIQNGVEVATCLASDFRAAMNHRDALLAAALKVVNDPLLDNACESLRALRDACQR